MRFVGVVTVVVLSGSAHADPEKAKQLVAEAEALVAAGDMLGAAAKFRAAYKVEPLPEHVCNTGTAYHKAQDLPRAHRYLNQCVTMGSSLEPAYRESLRKVVDATDAKLVAGDFTPLNVTFAPETAVGTFEGGKPYDDELISGQRYWIPYGKHRLVVRAEGFVEKVVAIDASRDDVVTARVELERKRVETPTVVVPVERSIEERPSRAAPIALTSGAVVLGVAAGIRYWMARDKMHEANDLTKTPTLEMHRERVDDAKDMRLQAVVVGGIAGGLAIASAYFWWRALKTPAPVEVTATGNGVAVRGRF